MRIEDIFQPINLAEATELNDSQQNRAIVQSLVDPTAQSRMQQHSADFDKMLSQPGYDHRPGAKPELAVSRQQQRQQWIDAVKYLQHYDDPLGVIRIALNKGITVDEVLKNLPAGMDLSALREQKEGVAEAKQTWQKHKNPRAGGMSKKAVRSYRRSNPGSKIQTAVTTKPSKLKKGSKSSKRRLSFCKRMRGMKKKRTSAKTARDPNSAINKSLRRWNCESVQDMHELVMVAERRIQALRESLRNDEHHRVRVTLDDGSEKTVRIKTDEGFRARIQQYFAQRGRKVIDIDVDWGVRMDEKQDACYRKVKSRYKVWPSAYASGALVQCRKKGADNWGKGS